MDNKHLGLYRLMEPAQQERVEIEFSVCFADLYDSMDDMRYLVRDLEQTITRIFRGEPTERMTG